MTWNGEGRVYPPAESPCCARCRRGTRAFGLLPCAVDLRCTCHRKVEK